MPTVLTHAVVAAGMGSVYADEPMGEDFWKVSVYCAMLPDADVLGFRFGIPYDAMLGHRGLSHSLAFAVALGVAAAAWVACRTGRPFRSLWAYFAAVTASHSLLDAFTNGGRGIAFLAPFSASRWFFPWTPIRVSPIGVGGVPLARWMTVLSSELVWVWLPVGAVAGAVWLKRRAEGGSASGVPPR